MYLGLGKEWVMIIFDKVIFGWAGRVAVFLNIAWPDVDH